jgi:CRP-like cAMP-binding protein
MEMGDIHERGQQNQVLGAFPEDNLHRVLLSADLVNLPVGELIYRGNQPMEDVYFPSNSVVSFLSIMRDGRVAEVGSVGNEGMVGLPIYLGTRRVRFEVASQIPGSALRVPAEVFEAEAQNCVQVRSVINRYIEGFTVQLAQTAACNAVHRIQQRVARWLLMAHDRASGDRFHTTHERLALMLGTRRQTVGEFAGMFQRAGLIDYYRGEILVLDRTGLERETCECYWIIADEFNRLPATEQPTQNSESSSETISE